MTGRVFDIQRFCIHDGPGIRTTVFLKGCPLRCKWCSNPESQSASPLLLLAVEKCIHCGACSGACKAGAICTEEAGGGKPRTQLDRRRCTVCGECVPVCHPKALEVVGRDVPVEEIVSTVLRDRDYYQSSGGGMTLSGGEPLFQPAFAEALLRAAKGRGLHCCVETAGFVEWSVVERIIPLVDLFLYDWKETNPQLHQDFTGHRPDRILANLRALHAAGANIIVRCPLIPQHNARREHLDGIAELSRALPRLKGVEVLPYHRLGRAKLVRFGILSKMPESIQAPERETIRGWTDYLRQQGVRVLNPA
jgi:glycyl-radical enzyme activating protein